MYGCNNQLLLSEVNKIYICDMPVSKRILN